jgi:hypothetical protein
MSRMIRLFSNFFDSVYKIGLYAPIFIILAVVALGHPVAKILSFKMKLNVLFVAEKILGTSVECKASRPNSILEFISGNSWQPLPENFNLKTQNWYSAVKKPGERDLQIDCGKFSIVFSQSNLGTVFRLNSSMFHLPIFEVSEGEAVFMTRTSEIGLAVNGWGHVFGSGVEQLTISRAADPVLTSLSKVSAIIPVKGQDAAFFIVRKPGLNANNSLRIEWNRGQNISIFTSDRQVGLRPVEPFLVVD